MASVSRRLSNRPLSTLVLLVVGLLCAFCVFAAMTRSGYFQIFDTRLLLAFRNPLDRLHPLGPLWFQDAMRDITALGSNVFLWLCVFLVSIYLVLQKKTFQSVSLLVLMMAGTATVNTLKAFFARPRPDLVPHEVLTFTPSFPSSHSALSAMLFLTLGWVLTDAKTSKAPKIYFMSAAASLTCLVGLSRVYLGVHWPSDVIAGWLFGITAALIFYIVSRLLNRAERHDPAENSETPAK